MKIIIVVALALVAAASALPVSEPVREAVKLLRSEITQDPSGSYSYGFESDDGISRQEQGELKEALDEENKPHNVVVVRGTYTFPGLEGKPVVINYFADETGYHAEGDSIPKAL